MDYIHEDEFGQSEVLQQLLVLLECVFRCKGLGKHPCDNWKKLLLLSLIVNQLSLFLFTTDVFELATDYRVPDTDSEGSGEVVLSPTDQTGSDEHHG